jgi:hypothetical protein
MYAAGTPLLLGINGGTNALNISAAEVLPGANGMGLGSSTYPFASVYITNINNFLASTQNTQFTTAGGVALSSDLPYPCFPGVISAVYCYASNSLTETNFNFGPRMAGAGGIPFGYYSYVFRNINSIGRGNIRIYVKASGNTPYEVDGNDKNVIGGQLLNPGQKLYVILQINDYRITDLIMEKVTGVF